MSVNTEWKPKIVAFCCNWCSYAGADLAGSSRLSYPADVKIIRVPCSCRVNPLFILRAFQRGADGVILCGCHPGDCHYTTGNYYARRRMTLLFSMLDYLGIDSRRTRVEWVSAAEGAKFAATMNDFARTITELGENRKIGGSAMQRIAEMIRAQRAAGRRHGRPRSGLEAGEFVYDVTPAVFDAPRSWTGLRLRRLLRREPVQISHRREPKEGKDPRLPQALRHLLLQPADERAPHLTGRRSTSIGIACKGMVDIDKIREGHQRHHRDRGGRRGSGAHALRRRDRAKKDGSAGPLPGLQGQKASSSADELIDDEEGREVPAATASTRWRAGGHDARRALRLLAERALPLHPLQRLPQRLPRLLLREVRVRQPEFRRAEQGRRGRL